MGQNKFPQNKIHSDFKLTVRQKDALVLKAWLQFHPQCESYCVCLEVEQTTENVNLGEVLLQNKTHFNFMLTKKTECAGFEDLALVSSTKNHNTSIKLHDAETKP